MLLRMSTEQAGDIGARIKVARRQVGLTQDALAAAVGVTRSAVAQWETARAGQVTGNLSRIAAGRDVGVEWLIHGDDKQAAAAAATGDELAMMRLYRECEPEDRQFLLRTAMKLVRAGRRADRG